MMYRLYEQDERLKLLWVIRLSDATSEQTGMSLCSQRDILWRAEEDPDDERRHTCSSLNDSY